MNSRYEMNDNKAVDTKVNNANRINNNDLATERGVDLNATSVNKHSMSKDMPPPPPPVPAIVQEAPADVQNRMNLFDYLEDLGGATNQIREDANTRAENEDLNNALNDDIPEQQPDPPEQTDETHDD